MHRRARENRFASLKQINAGVLNVGYAETAQPKVLSSSLLHGWPI